MTSFAVIVTNYNYKSFVIEAVDSALAQTHPPAQVIVVDDGSTDGSQDLLQRQYQDNPQVTLLFGENGGQLVAFQRGVAAAKADVVCFLDADDRWEPDYLRKLAELYGARKDVDFIFSDIQLFGNETQRIGYAPHALDLGYTVVTTYALTYWYGAPTSALSLRTKWACSVLDLPESFQHLWRLSADNCLVYGASVLGARKYYLPTGSVGYRIHGNNGWWSNRSPTATYLNRIRSRGLIAHYARIAGIDDSCIDLNKYEFKTKIDPPWDEIKRYAKLSYRTTGTIFKRTERALAILAYRFKKKRTRQP